MMKFCWLGLFFLSSVLSVAQKPAPSSTVSGRVFCSDTNAPARMAMVMLEPAETAGRQPSKAIYSQAVRTLLDGSFSIPHVAPGMYYLIASAPGYVSPLAALGVSPEDLVKQDDSLKQKINSMVPHVIVQANLPASIDVTLERGAAVSGTVLYDDGSPATGLDVSLLVRRKDKWVPIPSGPFDSFRHTETDDRGTYRISGLPAQEYLVAVTLRLDKVTYEFGNGGTGMSMSAGFSLPVYSGGAWRTKDATPFSVKLGEERHGEDVQIAISRLHTVRGTLTAAHDGHVVNGGSIQLLHADDKSEAAKVDLTKDDNGFLFQFIPDGDYILHVVNASDTEYEEIPNPPGTVPPSRIKSQVVRSYGPVDEPLHVDRDIIGLAVSVPDLAPGKVPGNQ